MCILDILERNAEFILRITNDGGTVTAIFNLPGEVNIGDELSWDYLGRLSNLKMGLGIEVFP